MNSLLLVARTARCRPNPKQTVEHRSTLHESGLAVGDGRGGNAQTTVDVWVLFLAARRVTLIGRFSDDIRERVEVALASHCGEQRSGFNRILHVHSLARASKGRERR